MTTIEHELLEQALESMCWAARTLDIDPDEAQNYHRSLENIRASLAAPATAPAWHDAPTCAGDWICACSGISVSVSSFNAHEVAHFEAATGELEGCRWYGPIPEDKP